MITPTGPEQPPADRTADRLMLRLKTHGPQTARALGAHLGISVPAVRQHVARLGEWVAEETRRQGVGRPAKVWRLTPAGHRRFPDAHAETTVRLIASTRAALGDGALDRILAHRHRENLTSYRNALRGCRGLEARLRALARLRTAEGYMAEVRQTDRGWLLVEAHCPICAAAEACQGFCANELDLFREVLGRRVRVERVEYLLDDGVRCSYEVTPALRATTASVSR